MTAAKPRPPLAPGETRAYPVLPLRDVAHPNAGFLKTNTNQDRTVNVPFRRGAPGVINIDELSKRLINATGTGISGTIDSAQFAMELLRFPFRQVFGDTEVDTGYDDFVATLSTAVLADNSRLRHSAFQRSSRLRAISGRRTRSGSRPRGGRG